MQRISLYRYLGIACSLVSFFAAGVSIASSQTRLLATGSSTVAPVMAELVRKYETLQQAVRIDVQTGGSSRGVADTASGQSDIGMVSRALKPAEYNLYAYTIANDGIAVIVHRDNPLTAIDKFTLQGIYNRTLREWTQLGGSAGQIVVVNKSAAHSTLELFLDYIELSPDQVKADIIIGDNQQGIKTITGNRFAIGYVSIGAALEAQQAGIAIKLLRLDGVEPTVGAVSHGSYPIIRPLNLVTRQPATGAIGEFIRFAGSAAGAAIIESLSFIPVQ